MTNCAKAHKTKLLQKIPLSSNNSIVYTANEVRPMLAAKKRNLKLKTKQPAQTGKWEQLSCVQSSDPISLPTIILRDDEAIKAHRNEILIFFYHFYSFFFVLVLHFATTWNSLHVSNCWESAEYLFVIIWITGKKNPYITNTNKRHTHKHTDKSTARQQQTKSLNHKPAKCTSTSV